MVRRSKQQAGSSTGFHRVDFNVRTGSAWLDDLYPIVVLPVHPQGIL